MSTDQKVAQNYQHGSLLAAIQAGIEKLGKTLETVTVEDLGPVDEFHIGGRVATDRLLKQLGVQKDSRVLDVGCGLGGAARYVAKTFNCQVSGVDLTEEYIATGNSLCSWVKLNNRVNLVHGNALDLPFEDNSFDRAYMLHVGMNIEDKEKLFTEINRVLKPGGVFGVYDVMQIQPGEMTYPVPWASEQEICKLASPRQYKEALKAAGFDVVTEANQKESAMEFFKNMRAKMEADGPPPLGLHTLMRASTPVRIQNMVQNIAAGTISPVEIISRALG